VFSDYLKNILKTSKRVLPRFFVSFPALLVNLDALFGRVILATEMTD
jgi:hypothetical protein